MVSVLKRFKFDGLFHLLLLYIIFWTFLKVVLLFFEKETTTCHCFKCDYPLIALDFLPDLTNISTSILFMWDFRLLKYFASVEGRLLQSPIGLVFTAINLPYLQGLFLFQFRMPKHSSFSLVRY
jgi:hypothetical protein